MADTEKIKGPASYFPSIEAKYGQPVEHWFDILRQAGDLKHMELVNLLKKSASPGKKIRQRNSDALVCFKQKGVTITVTPFYFISLS